MKWDIVTECGDIVGEVFISKTYGCYIARVFASDYGFDTLEETAMFLWKFGLDLW